MQAQDFHTLLKNASALNEEQLHDLQHIIEKYPYFQSAYLPLLRHYYNNNHIDFEDTLKLTVVYSSDRNKVRNYLRQQENSVVPTLAKEETTVPENKNTAATASDPLLDQLNHQILSEAVNFSLQQEVEKISKMPVQESLIEKEIVPSNTKQNFYDWLSKPKEEPKQKLKYEHLIDKFLTDQPRIVPKKEFFSPINMARKSVEEDTTIVSETLANLYVQQGHYSKALKAFEQLSLKFPKKSTYFAARIHQIEELKKNRKS